MPTRNALTDIFNTLFSRRMSQIGGVIILIFIALMLIGPYIIPYSPYATSSSVNSPPSSKHIFGTNYLGQDIFSQLVVGAYPSMGVGVEAASGAVLLGLLIGILGGYYRRLEALMAVLTNAMLTFPPLPLMVLLGSLFPVNNTLIALIMMVVLWPVVARSIYSQVLVIKGLPYVDVMKLSGLKNRSIIMRIIVPEVAPIAIAYFVLTVATGIVLVSALQFLGVGNPDLISWGSMLYWAQQFAFYYGDWWWILAPGLSISLVATGFALIGFSLEEVANPRLRVVNVQTA